jgi:hypothetical protein
MARRTDSVAEQVFIALLVDAGCGEVETVTTRFQRLHTPDGGYLNSE